MSASGVQRGVGRLSTHFFPLTVPPTLPRPQSRGSWRPPRRENGKTPPRLDHGNKSLYENSNSAARVFLSKFIGSPVVDRWPRRPYSSTLLKIGDSIIWILNTPNPRFIDGKSKRLLVSISWNTDIPVHDIKMKYIYILDSWEMTRFNKAWGVFRAANRSGQKKRISRYIVLFRSTYFIFWSGS